MNKEKTGIKTLLIVGLIIVAAYGCSFSEKIKQIITSISMGISEVGFNHKIHVTDEEISCDMCHADYETSKAAGMPADNTCTTCHDLEETETKDLLGKLIQEDGTLLINKRIMFKDTIFNHKLHTVDNNIECSKCHFDIERSTIIGKGQIPRMDTCLTCHQENKGNCKMCHSIITGLSFKPDSHKESWGNFHKRVKDSNYNFRDNKCNICHTENRCVKCHNERQPENHTGFWRQKGHGKFVSINRESCAVCHTTSYCVKCHAETRPRTHIGTWGRGQQQHCVTCHLPLGQEDGCRLCHMTGTPGHALASAKPDTHSPGMNCRQCHGAGQALPHIDKGDDCNICHK